jgi:hypothetical protein
LGRHPQSTPNLIPLPVGKAEPDADSVSLFPKSICDGFGGVGDSTLVRELMCFDISSRGVQAVGSLLQLLVYGKAAFDVLFGWRLAMSKRAPLRFRNRKLDHRMILLFDEALTFVTAHFEEVLPTL